MSDAHEAASPRGCYTFEQRRLVRPGLSSTNASAAAAACAAGGEKAASLQPAAAAAPGSRASGWRHFRRRLAPSCKELMYVCDGDRNGVVHYIGTDYGSKQWVNPVASKALDIKASSPPSRYTDPKVCVHVCVCVLCGASKHKEWFCSGSALLRVPYGVKLYVAHCCG